MIPSRKNQIERLKEQHFELLVIGGGATGAGIALDAALRGHRVALVEGKDFAEETSSRSTKLIHGGVRYLEKAVKTLDFSQFGLVKDALRERYTILKIAPHLTRKLPIVIPFYSWLEKVYYGMGIKIYDFLAKDKIIGMSRMLTRGEVIELFPSVNPTNLQGGVLYYDGQFDDARMNVSLVLSAALYGAVVANYVEVEGLVLKEGSITQAQVRDHLTDQTWNIQADVFINATGPFADNIRKMANPSSQDHLVASVGTHLLLDKKFTQHETGFLIPKTSDGRVLFLLPWEGSTLVGTTDLPTNIVHDPKPTEEEISYLLKHLNKYLNEPVAKSAIKASWAGIRPLIQEPGVKETSKLSRRSKVEIDEAGLYSVLGGKWTSYRKRAEKILDLAESREDLKRKGACVTAKTQIIGGQGYTNQLVDELRKMKAFDEDILTHLISAYGTEAKNVLALAKGGLEKRLAEGYPYIEAEVVFAIRHEYACTTDDIIFRRTRLGSVDKQAAKKAYPRVKQLLESVIEAV